MLMHVYNEPFGYSSLCKFYLAKSGVFPVFMLVGNGNCLKDLPIVAKNRNCWNTFQFCRFALLVK